MKHYGKIVSSLIAHGQSILFPLVGIGVRQRIAPCWIDELIGIRLKGVPLRKGTLVPIYHKLCVKRKSKAKRRQRHKHFLHNILIMGTTTIIRIFSYICIRLIKSIDETVFGTFTAHNG